MTTKTEDQLAASLNNETPVSLDSQPIVDPTESPEAAPGKRKYKARAPKGESNTPAADALDVLLNDSETPAATPTAKPARTKKKAGVDSTALGQQLVGIHQLAAMITGIQELQLAPEDGAALGKAIVAVCDEYNLSIDGKTGAGLQLFAAAAMIYAPRYFVFKRRVAMEQQAAVNANPA